MGLDVIDGLTDSAGLVINPWLVLFSGVTQNIPNEHPWRLVAISAVLAAPFSMSEDSHGSTALITSGNHSLSAPATAWLRGPDQLKNTFIGGPPLWLDVGYPTGLAIKGEVSMADSPAMIRYEEIRDKWREGSAPERIEMVKELEDMHANANDYFLTTEEVGKILKLRVSIDPSKKRVFQNGNWLLVELAPGEEG